MGGEISWHVELSIRPGQLRNFQTLTGEMVAATRRETGVLSFQRFVSEDGSRVHIYERYADSDAASRTWKHSQTAFVRYFPPDLRANAVEAGKQWTSALRPF
jgi:quinol monooxygenase YgiN